MFANHSNKARAVGAAMQHVRKRLCARLRELADGDDAAFAASWSAFVAEVEAGFWQEQSIMETLGYPGLQQHLADNACTLRALHRITPQVEAGEVRLGRQALAALGDILSLHRITARLAIAKKPVPTRAARGRFNAPPAPRAPGPAAPPHVARLRHHRH